MCIFKDAELPPEALAELVGKLNQTIANCNQEPKPQELQQDSHKQNTTAPAAINHIPAHTGNYAIKIQIKFEKITLRAHLKAKTKSTRATQCSSATSRHLTALEKKESSIT